MSSGKCEVVQKRAFRRSCSTQDAWASPGECGGGGRPVSEGLGAAGAGRTSGGVTAGGEGHHAWATLRGLWGIP